LRALRRRPDAPRDALPVRSPVNAANFQLFVNAIQRADPALTHEKSPALRLLCDEFKFAELGRKVQAFTDRWTSVVFEAETVQTCSKFHDNRSLLTQPCRLTSPIGADVFRPFVKAFDGISPTITNENVSDIGPLCEEFGHEQLSATASELLARHSSLGGRAWPEVAALKAQNSRGVAQLKAQNAALTTQVADLTAHHLREVAQLKEATQQMAAKTRNQFPALMQKKVTVTSVLYSDKRKIVLNVPDGIIARLKKECRGNVHDCHVGAGREGANPHSGSCDNLHHNAEKNARYLETVSYLH
jgi:hypothetical protein